MGFEWDTEQIPAYKLGLHIVQIVFSVVIWCLEIAVFRADKSKVTGKNGWTFAVCFLSVPAWLYLIMAPRWPRTRRLANAQAMLTVDGLFCIIWLSAFATQAAYNSAGLCGTGCGSSKAIVGLGVFEWLFWGVTAFLSVATLRYYEANGHLPGYDSIQHQDQNIDPDKAAFSMAPHDEEAYAPVGMSDDHDDRDYGAGSSYGGAGGAAGAADPAAHVPHDPHDPDAYHMASLGSRHDDDPFTDHGDTSYGGAGPGARYEGDGPGARIYAPPTALDDYDEDRPVQFPAADYNRIH